MRRTPYDLLILGQMFDDERHDIPWLREEIQEAIRIRVGLAASATIAAVAGAAFMRHGEELMKRLNPPEPS